MLERCDFQVKVAVVALRRQVSVEVARQLLDQAQGRVRQALDAG
jgi:N-acetylmuramic acid 6-phosphate etherase